MKIANLMLLQIFVVIFLFLSPFPKEIAAEANEEPLHEEMMDEGSFQDLQKHWRKMVDEYGGYLPDIKKTSLTDFLKRQDNISFQGIVGGFVRYLFDEIIKNGRLLGILLMLSLFSTLLQTIHSAFAESAIQKVTYFVVYLILIYLIMNSFFSIFGYVQESIEAMSGFMIALIPLLLGLMATLGNLATVSFFHPIIIFLVHMSGLLVSKFVLPLLGLSALLLLISHLNKKYQVTHLANLLKTVALSTLIAFLTIFVGVMSVQGTVSAIQDGVAIKTTKFITGNFIPVVGQALTEATDTILSASLLLKNAVGIVGVLIILFTALFPALKIVAIALIYKIVAAVIQPLGEQVLSDQLNMISQFILYILACLLVVTLMFFLAIVIITVSSNVTLFLR